MTDRQKEPPGFSQTRGPNKNEGADVGFRAGNGHSVRPVVDQRLTGVRSTMAELHPDALPTPRSTLRARYVRVLVWCKACHHQADADLQTIGDASHGDVPLIKLRFRCANCGSRLTSFLVTSRDNPQPW